MATMHVELVSIEEAIWSGDANAVYGRTPEGEIGILPGHQPLLGALVPGFPVRIESEDGDTITVAVHGGFLSVRQDGVSVLAEQAELSDDIDVARARRAYDENDPEQGPGQADAKLRAAARLRAAGESL